jgi:hypothetical protein
LAVDRKTLRERSRRHTPFAHGSGQESPKSSPPCAPLVNWSTARIPKRGPCSSAPKFSHVWIGRMQASLHHRQRATSAIMNRFYFHLVRGPARIIDRTGMEVDGAVLMLPIVFDLVKERWPGIADSNDWQGWTVEITDQNGHIIRTVSLL